MPKIENPSSIDNMEEITKELRGTEKIVMLDHEDLYAFLTKTNDSTKFQLYVEKLVGFCKKNNIGLIIPTRDGELEYFSTIKKHQCYSSI